MIFRRISLRALLFCKVVKLNEQLAVDALRLRALLFCKVVKPVRRDLRGRRGLRALLFCIEFGGKLVRIARLVVFVTFNP